MTPERIAELRTQATLAAGHAGTVDPLAVLALLAHLDTLTAENQRLHDLVRHQRGPLFDAGLITEEEYAALAGDHGAVARLEGYDRAQLARGAALLACAEYRATAERLTAERDELAATLANERGEGEPPSGRWTWSPIRRLWWADDARLEPCPGGYRWANTLTNEEARTSKILTDGKASSQRAAMRAADAAYLTTTTSPDAATE